MVRLISDVPYAYGQSLDVYLPPETIKPPYRVFFYVHGGALHIGHRSNARDVCTQMALRGYMSVAPSYSLSSLSNDQLQSVITLVGLIMLSLAVTSGTGMQFLFMLILTSIILLSLITLWTFVPREQVSHPDHIKDVAAAFRWTYDHAVDYGGDPTFLVAAGHSSGAHLASLLSTNERYLQDVGLTLENVKACVGISGVYSDQRLKEVYLGKQLLMNAFGNRPSYYDAFPIYNVGDRTPPFLLMNAASDISLKQHSFDLHYTLLDHGAFSEIAYFPGTHFTIVKNIGVGQEHEDVLNKIQSFLDEISQA